MILGLRNMLESVEHYWHDHVTSDGGLSLVGLDGLLLIPLIFAVFFYPMAISIGVVAALIVAVAVWEVRRFAHSHQHHWFWHR